MKDNINTSPYPIRFLLLFKIESIRRMTTFDYF